MNCADVEHQLERYISSDLPPEERAALDDHCRACPACRALVSELEEAAALVYLALPQVEPPPRLRQRLLAAAHAADRPARAPAPARRPPWYRRLNPTRLAVAMSGVSLALALGLGGWVVVLSAEVNRQAAENQRLTAQVARQRYSVYALRESVAMLTAQNKIERVVSGSDNAPQARGLIYYDPGAEKAMLVTSRLPPPAPDRVYQVWLRNRHGVVSAGQLQFDESGAGYAVLHAPGPLDQFEVVGISLEPSGGSPQPTGPRMMGGPL
jgi:anti-sigma-K factor RskA